MGDHDALAAWLATVEQADTALQHRHDYGAVLDAVVLFHRGDMDAALERVGPEPDQVWKWVCWIWLDRYGAIRARRRCSQGTRTPGTGSTPPAAAASPGPAAPSVPVT